ncbi:MAG: phosphatidylglycerophosphatase A [Gammaproteobacteria bacterium]
MGKATGSGHPEGALAHQVLRDPVHWLAFGLGTGLLPRAPGTWGSLLAVGIFWLLPPLSLQVQVIGLTVAFVAGCVICGASARRLGVHDHGGIVLDEIVAMYAVLCFVPRTAAWTIVAFLLFRFFDIVKPWPIREADHRIGGGLGIMLDDVLAAVYAALLVRGVLLLPLS